MATKRTGVMKRKKVTIPIYFGRLIIIQDIGWEEVEEEYNVKVENDTNAIAFHNTTKSGLREYMVAFGTKEPRVGTIAHEVVHIVNQIFTDVGIKLDRDNDEPQAYLTGWIADQIANFIYEPIYISKDGHIKKEGT